MVRGMLPPQALLAMRSKHLCVHILQRQLERPNTGALQRCSLSDQCVCQRLSTPQQPYSLRDQRESAHQADLPVNGLSAVQDHAACIKLTSWTQVLMTMGISVA